MVGRSDRMFGFALCLLAVGPLARADNALDRPTTTAAPMETPHATELALAEKARKREHRPDNIENLSSLILTPGLKPLVWPRNDDVRARILTTEVKNTPVVGWLAANLYRSKKDNGWCLEVDPGQGEYVVFYRLNMK
jgi:hypothetical protein